MVKDTEQALALRREFETTRRDLVEINRSGLAQAARILEIMNAALDGGEDVRIWSGLHQLKKLFAPTGEPDTMVPLLAEMAELRARADDPAASDDEADAALDRIVELDDRVRECRPTTLAGAVLAISWARREWETYHADGGPDDAVISALLAGVDVLTWLPPMARTWTSRTRTRGEVLIAECHEARKNSTSTTKRGTQVMR